jgi:hypothetical protein
MVSDRDFSGVICPMTGLPCTRGCRRNWHFPTIENGFLIAENAGAVG